MARPTAAVAALVGVLLLVGTACGESKGVGDESLLDFEERRAAERLGETTTTAAAPSTTAAPGKVGIGGPSTTATTRPPQTTTTTVRIGMDIAINADKSNSTHFDPLSARVVVGTIVRWTNKDTQPRSVEADDGSFASPTLAPGQSWTYRTTTVGKLNYHDGTRPYAVASLEVVARS